MKTRTRGCTRVRPVMFRHDLRALLPANLQPIIQDGMLDGIFRQALVPEFRFPRGADLEPLDGRLGQRITMQRTGLLTVADTPITGNDASDEEASVEFFEAVLDQYGKSTPTNMLANATAAARKYVQDVRNLGENAGRSLNSIARNRMYAKYGGGRTFVRTAGNVTDLEVDDATGFDIVLNAAGQPVAVSGTNALTVTVGGSTRQVTGVDLGTNTITLSVAVNASVGDAVIASNASVSIRPGAKESQFTLTGADIATMGLFLDAVARLRRALVPPAEDGLYLAHISPETNRQLLDDTAFRNAFQGAHGTMEIAGGEVTDFGGCRFVSNTEVPVADATTNGGSVSSVTRDIVVGGGHLIATPMNGISDLLAGTGVEGVPNIEMIDVGTGLDVALIVRPPQDRLQQVVNTTWAWVGDFAVPTDAGTGDAALCKRAVVVEHA